MDKSIIIALGSCTNYNGPKTKPIVLGKGNQGNLNK